MTKKKFLLGMLVLALVFGMSVIGCGEDEEPTPPPQDNTPQPGSLPSNAIDRVETIDLGTMTEEDSGWQQLLSSIGSTKKYVNLDLSACTMTETSFNPDATADTGKLGKHYIVSIILPNAATSIAAGTSDLVSTFNGFIALKSVKGTNITTIGNYSFSSSNGNLESVDFPKATAIGNYAFYFLTIKNFDFPLVTTIGNNAFASCKDLQSLNIPSVTTIGNYVFSSTGSTSLSITMGASAPKVGTYTFQNVQENKTITVKVPSEATGYSPFNGTSVTVSGSNSDQNWANGFRAKGWNGSSFSDSTASIFENITLTIEQQ